MYTLLCGVSLLKYACISSNTSNEEEFDDFKTEEQENKDTLFSKFKRKSKKSTKSRDTQKYLFFYVYFNLKKVYNKYIKGR